MKIKYKYLNDRLNLVESEGNRHYLILSNGEKVEVATTMEQDGYIVTDIKSGLCLACEDKEKEALSVATKRLNFLIEKKISVKKFREDRLSNLRQSVIIKQL